MDAALQTTQRHTFLKTRFETVTIDDGLTLPDLTTNSMVQTDASGKLETVQQVYYDNSLAALVSTTAIQCNNCKITSQLETSALILGSQVTSVLTVTPSISAFYTAPWLASGSVPTTVLFSQIDERWSIIIPQIDLTSNGLSGQLLLNVPSPYLPSSSVKIKLGQLRLRSDTFLTEFTSLEFDSVANVFKCNFSLAGGIFPSVAAGTVFTLYGIEISWQQI